jgi:hypothetical protein
MSVSGWKNIVTLTAGDRGNLAKDNYILFPFFKRFTLKENESSIIASVYIYEKMSICYLCALIL